MNNRNASSTFLALGALLLGIASILLSLTHTPNVGGVTNYDTLFVKSLKVGPNGSIIGGVYASACNLLPAATTIAATTTLAVDCQASAVGLPQLPLTGVQAGDAVQIQQSTTTPTLFEGLQIRGASASSTPGYITVLVYNGTGNTYTWTSAATSSLVYQDANPGTIQGI